MNQIKIGRFITEKRKSKNLTQEELAEKIGVSNKTVSKWERGKCMPDYSVIELLCKELQISVQELIQGESLLQEQKQTDDNVLMLLKDMRSQRFSNMKIKTMLIAICGILMYVLCEITPPDANLFVRICANVGFIGSIISEICFIVAQICIWVFEKKQASK